MQAIMATRRTGKIEGSNLRILAIAFANSRIDRKTYLRLRTLQLSALEFSKPLPPLPPELLDINVPSVKIDAPHISKRDNGPIIRWVIIAIAVLAIATAAYVTILMLNSSSGAGTAPTLTLEQQAQTLLTVPTWSQQEMETFSGRWSALSNEEKLSARQAPWFPVLESDIVRRINLLKQQRGDTDDIREYQSRLNALRVFYAEVVAE
jgi:hypothetical protein